MPVSLNSLLFAGLTLLLLAAGNVAAHSPEGHGHRRLSPEERAALRAEIRRSAADRDSDATCSPQRPEFDREARRRWRDSLRAAEGGRPMSPDMPLRVGEPPESRPAMRQNR